MTGRCRLVCACALLAVGLCSCLAVRTVRISPEDEEVLVRQLSAREPGARAVSARLLLVVDAGKYTHAAGKQLEQESDDFTALNLIQSLGAFGTRDAIPYLESRLADHSKVQFSVSVGQGEEEEVQPPDIYVISDAAAKAIQEITRRLGAGKSRSCPSSEEPGGRDARTSEGRESLQSF